MKSKASDILRRVQKIEFSTRKLVNSIVSGQYHTRFKGQGMQFSDFREYDFGDDIRHIDWKVTARTQSAHIRKFEEERDLTVYLLVDISRSGRFSTTKLSKTEVLIEVAALLAFAAVKNNDRVGLILFTDQIEKHVPPKKGRAHAMRIVTELLTYTPSGRKTNISLALDHFFNAVKHTSILILASDFIDQNFDSQLTRVARKHDVVALHVRDLRDVEFPNIGQIDFIDPESGDIFSQNINSHSFQKFFESSTKTFNETVIQKFKKSGVDRLELWTHLDYFNQVVGYFKVKKR